MHEPQASPEHHDKHGRHGDSDRNIKQSIAHGGAPSRGQLPVEPWCASYSVMIKIFWRNGAPIGKRTCGDPQNRIGYLLKRPVGRPPHEVRRSYANFTYQAGS
jgi:hypothetical protein